MVTSISLPPSLSCLNSLVFEAGTSFVPGTCCAVRHPFLLPWPLLGAPQSFICLTQWAVPFLDQA